MTTRRYILVRNKRDNTRYIAQEIDYKGYETEYYFMGSEVEWTKRDFDAEYTIIKEIDVNNL